MISRGRLLVMGFVLLLVVALAAAGAAQASSIFFIRSNEIWVANPDGSGARQVTTDGGSGQPYVWVSAAKGNKPILAYLRDNTTGGSPQQLYGTINPDGTGSTVNPDNYPNMQPYTLPWGTNVSIDAAGDRMAWPSSRPSGIGSTYYYAFSVGVDGTNEAHLDTAAAIHVTFGDPAGQTLLFEDLTAGYNGLPASCVSNSVHYVLVHQMPAPTGGTPGSPSFYCLAGGPDLLDPALSPNGQMLAAVHGPSPNTLVTIPMSGVASTSSASPATQVTPSGVSADAPDFSPDGTRIAFEGAGSTIDTVPASGGTPTQVLTNATSPAWSPYTLPGGPGGGGGGGGQHSVQLARLPKSTGSGVTFELKCSAPAGQSCQTADTLTSTETVNGSKLIAVSAAHKSKKHKRTVVVGRKSVTISAGRTATITIALNAQGRQLLKHFKRLPVTLTIKLTSNGKTTVSLKRKVTVKPKKKIKKKGRISLLDQAWL